MSGGVLVCAALPFHKCNAAFTHYGQRDTTGHMWTDVDSGCPYCPYVHIMASAGVARRARRSPSVCARQPFSHLIKDIIIHVWGEAERNLSAIPDA